MFRDVDTHVLKKDSAIVDCETEHRIHRTGDIFIRQKPEFVIYNTKNLTVLKATSNPSFEYNSSFTSLSSLFGDNNINNIVTSLMMSTVRKTAAQRWTGGVTSGTDTKFDLGLKEDAMSLYDGIWHQVEGMMGFFERIWKRIIAWFALCLLSLILFILGISIAKFILSCKPVLVVRLLLEPFFLAWDLAIFFAHRFHLIGDDQENPRLPRNMVILPNVENVWQEFRN